MKINKTVSRLSVKAFWILVLLFCLIAAVWLTGRWHSTAGGSDHSSADKTARAGDVKRGPDGRLLYFDGRQWTDKPLPAQDTPF